MSFSVQSWSESHRAVARRWGLVVDDYWHIHGVLDRVPVSMMVAPHINARGSGGGLFPDDTVYSALLPKGAPLWFNCAEKTLQEKIGGFFASLVSKPSGHEAFDARFAIHADDPAEVAALLDAEAQSVMRKLADDRHHPLLTAQLLSLRRLMGASDREEQIEAALRSLVDAAHSIARSFALASMSGGYR